MVLRYYLILVAAIQAKEMMFESGDLSNRVSFEFASSKSLTFEASSSFLLRTALSLQEIQVSDSGHTLSHDESGWCWWCW